MVCEKGLVHGEGREEQKSLQTLKEVAEKGIALTITAATTATRTRTSRRTSNETNEKNIKDLHMLCFVVSVSILSVTCFMRFFAAHACTHHHQ